VHNKLTAQLPGALTGWFGALLRVEIRLTHLNSREAANAGTGKESEARWTRWEQAWCQAFSVGSGVDINWRQTPCTRTLDCQDCD
jgi:hypothetical protein